MEIERKLCSENSQFSTTFFARSWPKLMLMYCAVRAPFFAEVTAVVLLDVIRTDQLAFCGRRVTQLLGPVEIGPALQLITTSPHLIICPLVKCPTHQPRKNVRALMKPRQIIRMIFDFPQRSFHGRPKSDQ